MSLQIEPFSADRIRAEIGKLMAQTAKLAAEQAEFNAKAIHPREYTWLPIFAVVAAAAAGATLAIALSRFCST
ncbi:hypothetical protein V9L20_12565 [Variovorax sp. CCNWLW225]|uniref:hypothetical protein n=1 Tax=Variovorax sp. CCNWLW225 TaxID=3127462 RepID=UPI003077D6A7